ncbi:MAG: hypothetical protein ACK5MQ_02245 [Pikeienuella sp.]
MKRIKELESQVAGLETDLTKESKARQIAEKKASLLAEIEKIVEEDQ